MINNYEDIHTAREMEREGFYFPERSGTLYIYIYIPSKLFRS